MNATITILISVLSSGVIAVIVSAMIQKRHEKESRLFNAKLEAYKDFIAHLESRFVSLIKEGKDLELMTLAEESAGCLLVSNEPLNKELKAFLTHVSDVYKRCHAPDYDAEKEKGIFDELWDQAEKVEGLMRKDLGF